MAVAGETVYDGKVLPGAQIIQSSKRGTLGYEVPLECADGRIKHVIWLTSTTMDHAEKTFQEALGVSKAQLQDEEFVTKKLAEYITGRDVKFTTETDAQGYVKVKWLNGAGGGMGAPAAPKLLSDFFRKPSPPAAGFPPADGGSVIDDSMIPF